MAIDTNHFKEKLLEEKRKLEEDLAGLGVKDPDNPDDWVAKPEDAPQMTADKNEMADRLEDFEQTRSTEVSLELRLNNVKKALKKIEEGTYGKCEVGNEDIPLPRLEANPAATTCINHAQ